MKIHPLTAETVGTTMGNPGRGFQGPWLPVKLGSIRQPDLVRADMQTHPHRPTDAEVKRDPNGDCGDVVFLGGVLSFYGKTRDGSIILSRARIMGIHIDTWA